MPKHKKTREQKMKADERRASLSATMPNPTYSFSFSQPVTTVKQHTTPAIHIDQSVRKDLLKTAIVSFVILFLQIVLYILLRNHLLAFSFVRY